MAKNTLQRLKEYIDLKGITIRAFELSLGMSNGSFSSQLKNNRTIGVDKLENILNQYNDINIEWLLTGRGNMIKDSHDFIAMEPPALYNSTNKKPNNTAMDAKGYERIISALEKTVSAQEGEIETLKREIGRLRKMTGEAAREMDAAV